MFFSVYSELVLCTVFLTIYFRYWAITGEVTMHQWQLLMTFLSNNMTCYIVASTFKSTFKTLFFLVVELNLILYSPDIEVAKKDAAAFTEYCSKQVYHRVPNNRKKKFKILQSQIQNESFHSHLEHSNWYKKLWIYCPFLNAFKTEFFIMYVY